MASAAFPQGGYDPNAPRVFSPPPSSQTPGAASTVYSSHVTPAYTKTEKDQTETYPQPLQAAYNPQQQQYQQYQQPPQAAYNPQQQQYQQDPQASQYAQPQPMVQHPTGNVMVAPSNLLGAPKGTVLILGSEYNKKYAIWSSIIFFVVFILCLGIGLGVGLKRRNDLLRELENPHYYYNKK